MTQVCIITTIHPAYEARIFERCAVPLSKNYSVVVIAPWIPRTDKLNIKIVSLKFPKNRFSRIFHGFKTFSTALRYRSSIYHFHDLDFLPWALLLKIFTKSKVIYDCHENYAEEILFGKPWIPLLFRYTLSKFVGSLEIFSLKFFDAVVVVVENQVEKFSKHNVNTTLIRNLSVYSPQKEIIHKLNVLYTGTISRNYGSDNLIKIANEILKNNKTYLIYVFDKFDASVKDEFVNLIKKYSLPICILDRFERSEIVKIMALGCIGLSLEQNTINKRLAIPAKLFEYMSFGIPIIASNLPNNSDILEISKSGILVKPDNYLEFYEKIEYLMNNPKEREKLVSNGFKAIENEFNWTLEEQKLLNLYERL